MGRDVQYSPFTWQNQSTAHNRLLKFLVVIILLSLVSFYIGYPEQNLETPKTESRNYRLEKLENIVTSETERRFEESSNYERFEVKSTETVESSTSISPNQNENVSFDNSVVPSGPNADEIVSSSAEKLKLLEEGERKIIESQETDFGRRDEVEEETTTIEVSNIGIETAPSFENAEVQVEKKGEETTTSENETTTTEGVVDLSVSTETTETINEETTPEIVSNSTIGIEEAEKQLEQVSANLTLIEIESTTKILTLEEENGNSTTTELTNSTETSKLDEEKENKMFENLSECRLEEWNNVTLDEIPYQSVFKQWIDQNSVTGGTNETEKIPKVLGAFAYKNHIAVTLSSKNFSSGTVYCRYYDCNKKQLVRQMTSFVFPESTVYCPRRAGAKFISISESLEDKGQHPVEILKRLVPHHFFTVCVAVNNQEENILKISRFIEYYKLQGSTFFHVYLKNSSHYQRMLLDDYVRTGDVKVIKIGENVTEKIQANDCQHRSKYFSKWTAFLNLEDELKMREDSETISSYLDSIVDHKTNILKWNSPENNETRLLIRPERIISINSSPLAVYLGNQLEEDQEPSGLLAKFSKSSELAPENFSENVEENIPFRDELIENVLSRTNHVFTTIESDNQKETTSKDLTESGSSDIENATDIE